MNATAISDPAAEIVPNRRLLRDHVTMVQWVQWIAHASVNGFLVAFFARETVAGFTDDFRLLAVILVMTFSAVCGFIGFHRRFVVGRLGLWRVTEVWVVTCLMVAAILFSTGTVRRFDPLILGGIALFGYAAHMICFWVFRLSARFWQRSLSINISSLVVGTGSLGTRLVQSINRNDYIPMRVVGTVALDSNCASSGLDSLGVPVVGHVEQLDRIIEQGGFDRVYIALDAKDIAHLRPIQKLLLAHQVDVIWVPDIFDLDLLNPSVRELGGLPVISLSESPLISGPKAFLKSAMDVFITVAALVCLLPLFLVIGVLIKLGSPGPVFYRQVRHGWDGSPFRIWKFRTMYLHDESHGIEQAKSDDERITPIGRILRKTSIDELPQLFNVLDGSMSLVGPRPHAVEHNHKFSARLNAYMARHRVKPGITGWAQINGYRGETDTDEKMLKRLDCDLHYINRWSLKLDLFILFLTPFRLFNENAR
ncbi:MAG: undecaprenyl-phosphate glucose phosphotransferase [Pseudomonadota bacterium]